jgi:hypothetical protein
MSKLRLAVVLATFVIGLALPAWAVGAPSEQTPNSDAAAQSGQARTDTSKDADSTKDSESTKSPGAKGKNTKSRGPTAAMDRATPMEKSPEMQGNSPKHPPTARMDQATPAQKSPSASAPQASGSEGDPPATK